MLKFFRWFCNPEFVDDIEGDLLERYATDQAKHGQRFAKRKLNKGILQLFRPAIIRPISTSQKLNFITMFKHNILINFRSYKRYKRTFLINLFGLATGIASALLIFLWVNDELNINHFNEKDSDRHVQVIHTYPTSGSYHTEINGSTPNPLFERLPKDLPEIEYSFPVKAHPSYRGVMSANEKNLRAQYQFIGKGYFNVFPSEFIHGNKYEILTDPGEVAITEQLAIALFGTSQKAMGQLVEFKDENYGGAYLVTGVFKKNEHSTEVFDMLFSYELFQTADLMQWYNSGTQSHLVLRKETDLAQFNAKLENYLSTLADNWKDILYAQPYNERYLYGQFQNGIPVGGKITYVKLFTTIAFLILIIACINYMNFSTAQASRKAKEIGIKKTIGAKRKSLIYQYFSESILLAFIALAIALILVYALLPQFNQMTGKSLAFNFSSQVLITIIGITLLTGVVSGLYPALLLSSFNPITALKGSFNNKNHGIWARKGLVVFQFIISVILITSATVIYQQIKFIQDKNLGYKKEHIITIPKEGKLSTRHESFITALKSVPGVVNATYMTGDLPGKIDYSQGYKWEGMNEADKKLRFYQIRGGHELPEMLGITLKEGRFFSRDHSTDSDAIILNEAAAEMIGQRNSIGLKLGNFNPRARTKEVVGIAENFHFQSLHEEVRPFFFSVSDQGKKFVVKMQAGEELPTIDAIADLFEEFNPDYPFEYRFLDDYYQSIYASEQRITELSKYFTAIAVIISCLGLLALTAFSAQRRFKEIAIRKVLGSSYLTITRFLSYEFLILVAISIGIATPISYFVIEEWLNGFAYRIDLGVSFFIFSGLIMMAIAWITIMTQTLKSAKLNMTEALRSE